MRYIVLEALATSPVAWNLLQSLNNDHNWRKGRSFESSKPPRVGRHCHNNTGQNHRFYSLLLRYYGIMFHLIPMKITEG